MSELRTEVKALDTRIDSGFREVHTEVRPSLRWTLGVMMVMWTTAIATIITGIITVLSSLT